MENIALRIGQLCPLMLFAAIGVLFQFLMLGMLHMNRKGEIGAGGEDEGSEDAANGDEGTGDTGKETSPPPVDWISTLPSDQKALVGIKGWKTPTDTIKGYSELEKLVGHEKIAMPRKDKDGNYEKGEFERVMGQLGMPKTPKEYKESATFKLPEGIPENSKFTESFRDMAHKAGLLPHQYAMVMDHFISITNQGLSAQKEQSEKSYNEAAFNLKNKYGAAYEEKVHLSNRMLNSFATNKEHGEKIVKKYGNDPDLIEFMVNVSSSLSEDSISKHGITGELMTPQEASFKVKEIMSDMKHPYYNREHPQHNYWVDKIAELNRIASAGS